MLADFREAELDHRVRFGGDMEFGRANTRFVNTFPLCVAGVDGNGLCTQRTKHIFLPRDLGSTIGTIEKGFIGWEMLEPKLVVAHGEVSRCEFLSVCLLAHMDMSGAPAGIDELPLAVINFNSVPGMGAEFRWDGLPGFEGGPAGTFTVAADYERFQSGFGSDGGEETSVTFADS